MADTGFWELARREPGRPALVEPDGRRLTAGALLAGVNQAVHGLRALGLKPGDTVATVLANEASMVELALAAAQAGFYLTPINRNLTPPEIGYIAADCDARAIVFGPQAHDAVLRASHDLKLERKAMFSTGASSAFRPYAELQAWQPTIAP